MDAVTLTRLRDCPAPAKLNLFLHVTGRRADGYHLLQTAFRLLDWSDLLSFTLRDDASINRLTALPGIAADDDLSIRAARLLQQSTGCSLGVDIEIDKRLPSGGGIGGGSSDAATTLIALNRLWRTGQSREQLAALGLELGADVPFFIYGKDAFAEGVGERFLSLSMPNAWYVVIAPPVNVPTREIFSAKELTRNSKPIRISDFAFDATRNDLQAVACNRYPEIGEVIEWLERHAAARMTGSGACVFAQVTDESLADRIVLRCPRRWRAWKTRSLSRHPLYSWID